MNDRTLSARARQRLRDFFDRFLRRRTRGRLNVEAPVFLDRLMAENKGMRDLVARRVAEGAAEGEAHARRDSIRKALEARFGRVSKSFVTTLERTTDLKRLERAFVVALTAESVAEVARALGKPVRARRQPSRASTRA